MLIALRWARQMSHLELLFGSLGILKGLQLALKQLIFFAHCLQGVKLLKLYLCTVQIPGRGALRAKFMVFSIMLSSRHIERFMVQQILSHHERQI